MKNFVTAILILVLGVFDYWLSYHLSGSWNPMLWNRWVELRVALANFAIVGVVLGVALLVDELTPRKPSKR